MFQIRKELKGFILGVLVTFLLTSTLVYAKQSEEFIAVSYNNIKIFLNGLELDLTDEGTPAEPFLYNGRAYLPVRAISEALGLDVKWDDVTTTIRLTSISDLPKDQTGDPAPKEENAESLVGKTWSGTDISVTINGVRTNTKFDAPPINGDGDLLVPVKVMMMIPNMSVTLDTGLLGNTDPSKMSIVFNDLLRIKYNDNTAYFSDGSTKQMPVAPMIHDGWTMVPIKFITEQFGYDCSYDATAKSITLVSK